MSSTRWLDAGTSRRLTACLSRRIGWRRQQRRDLGQDLQHDRPRDYTGNIPNVRVANTRHPRADGGTLAVEPSPRMPLGMPRQQHMVMGQRLGDTAGHRDDIQRRSRSDPVAWGDNHRRAQLGDAVRVRNFRPDNATELEWPRHTSPLCALRTAWARPLQTTAGEEGRLGPPAPNRPGPRAARPPAAPGNSRSSSRYSTGITAATSAPPRRTITGCCVAATRLTRPQ